MLATLDFIPSATGGTVSEENGRTVITVEPGSTVNVTGQISTAERDVQGFQVNFSNSSNSLGLSNFSAASDFPISVDSTLNSPANDFFVAGAITGQLPAPPTRAIGTFEVVAPNSAGDFVMTADLTTGTELTNTIISDASGTALPITDFGDLVIRVTGTGQRTATLDLVPTPGNGTISEENGRTVVTVDPGTVVSVNAQVTAATDDVQGFQLNLSQSDTRLAMGSFSLGTDFPLATDTTLNSGANDFFVAGALNGQLDVPPSRSFGTFNVTAPSAAGDYVLTSNFTTGTELTNTLLSDAGGSAFAITDFGDLVVRVRQQTGTAETTIDLVPAAGSGPISEEGGVTVVTVDPGTSLSVTAQVLTATADVQGVQLNFSQSDSQLALGSFALGTDFPLGTDTTLNSGASDFFVAGAFNGQLTVPPPRVFGSFDVTAPTAAGDYRLTSNFTTGTELTNTLVSDAGGNALSITDFGDLIVRVGQTTTGAAELDLVPAASSGTISEENGRTVVTVSPGSTVNVSAQVTAADQDVQGFQLNFSSSSSQLAIGNFALGTDFPLAADNTLNSGANDFFVAGAVTGQLAVPPARTFGNFNVTAPTAPGDYLVSSNFTTGTELTNTLLSDSSGNAFSINDFGDLIVRVQQAGASEATLDLIPDSASGTVSEESGRTVITVSPGTLVNVDAQVTGADPNVQGFQLNFSNTASELVLGNFALGTDFPLATDQTLNSGANDFFVAGAVNGQLAVPPARSFGSFDVTAPTAPGDYLVTSDFTTGTELNNTIISDAAGSAVSITDFGDLIVRVQQANVPEATLDLLPDSGSGTVSEESGRTVITVSPGAVVNVDAQVTNAEQDVQGFQLNLSNSASELVLGNFAIGTDFPLATDQTLNSGANDFFVAGAVNGELAVPPIRVFGSFDVTAPTAPGDYVVTSNFTAGTELTNTLLSDGNGNAFTISEFGDLVVRVQQEALPTVSFATSAQSISETAGSSTVTVNLSATSDSVVTVPFTVSGTATSGSDFTVSTSPITFAAGTTSADITIDVINDGPGEPDETVILTLGAPTGAELGSSIVHTATLLDVPDDPTPGTASLSGLVYLDVNGNATRDGNEPGIPGVIMELDGADTSGNSVQLRALTGNDGAYAFVDLPPGDYTINENQPGAFVDGDESEGTQGGTITDDSIQVTNLAAGQEGLNNNFGEARLARGQLSMRYFLASTDKPTLYRNANADAAERAGNSADADAIRNATIPSVVSFSDGSATENRSSPRSDSEDFDVTVAAAGPATPGAEGEQMLVVNPQASTDDDERNIDRAISELF